MNITELLAEDHREVESLIAQLEGGADKETFTKLKNSLLLHAQVEEKSTTRLSKVLKKPKK